MSAISIEASLLLLLHELGNPIAESSAVYIPTANDKAGCRPKA